MKWNEMEEWKMKEESKEDEPWWSDERRIQRIRKWADDWEWERFRFVFPKFIVSFQFP